MAFAIAQSEHKAVVARKVNYYRGSQLYVGWPTVFLLTSVSWCIAAAIMEVPELFL